MTDLGSLNYFLGISVVRSPAGLFLSQQKYATEILEPDNMMNCNPCRTPVEPIHKLDSISPPFVDPTFFRSLAGALQYLTFTRPDITIFVQKICLYMHDPRELHLHALKKILRYLRGTLDHGLQTHVSPTESLVACSDGDWGMPSLSPIYIRTLCIFRRQPNFMVLQKTRCNDPKILYVSEVSFMLRRIKLYVRLRCEIGYV